MAPFWIFVLALLVVGVALVLYAKAKPASKEAADVSKVEATVAQDAKAAEAALRKVL